MAAWESQNYRERQQISGCQELGVGCLQSDVRKFREWGNGAALYLDFGGGYTTVHLSNFIELCTKRDIFLYIIYILINLMEVKSQEAAGIQEGPLPGL